MIDDYEQMVERLILNNYNEGLQTSRDLVILKEEHRQLKAHRDHVVRIFECEVEKKLTLQRRVKKLERQLAKAEKSLAEADTAEAKKS
jgi:G:T-mismatch repair DNA endonuclease (very short patch repair protein)